MIKNNYFISIYNKIKQNVFIVNLIIGIGIFYYMFWSKFLRVRLPRSIDEILIINNIFIYINIFFFSIACISNITFLIKKNEDSGSLIMKYIKNIPYIYKILDIIIWIHKNIFSSPKTVYKYISNYINLLPHFEPLCVFVSESCDNYYKNKNKNIYNIIYLCLNSLPKVLIALTFLIEIILYHQLNLFYKSLFLYLVPLLYNIIHAVIDYLCDDMTYYSTAHIIIEKLHGEEIIKFRAEIPDIPNAMDIVKRKSDAKLLKWFLSMYDTYETIKDLTYSLTRAKQFIRTYETIVICSLYLIGWVYILCYSLL